MPYVCRGTGHIDEDPDGRYCTRHGAPFITHCSVCSSEWTAMGDPLNPWRETGSDFCSSCGVPGLWVGRETLIDWLRDRLNDAGVDSASRLELAGVLDQLAAMAPDDTKALAAWQTLQRRAPQVWELAKPIVSSLVNGTPGSTMHPKSEPGKRASAGPWWLTFALIRPTIPAWTAAASW